MEKTYLVVVFFFKLSVCALVVLFFFLKNEFTVLIEVICIYCKYLNTGIIQRRNRRILKSYHLEVSVLIFSEHINICLKALKEKGQV